MSIKNLRLYKEEEGNGLVWFVLFFFVIFAMIGLVVDGGMLYKTRSALKKTANAAALSGAQELKSVNQSKIVDIVETIVRSDGEESSLVGPPNIVNGKPSKVSVTLERKVPLSIMKIFNFGSVPVRVRSTAVIYPVRQAEGAVPLGITKEDVLEAIEGKIYSLKVGPGESESGNFGALTLTDGKGGGAKIFENNLRNGYKGEIIADEEDGSIFLTETGNMSQPTVRAINDRIEKSPTTQYDEEIKDDPRIIRILVYEVHEMDGNQVKSIQVVGFAHFYLMEPMSHNDSYVKGQFIEYVGKGIGDENAPDYGSYAIKLTE